MTQPAKSAFIKSAFTGATQLLRSSPVSLTPCKSGASVRSCCALNPTTPLKFARASLAAKKSACSTLHADKSADDRSASANMQPCNRRQHEHSASAACCACLKIAAPQHASLQARPRKVARLVPDAPTRQLQAAETAVRQLHLRARLPVRRRRLVRARCESVTPAKSLCGCSRKFSSRAASLRSAPLNTVCCALHPWISFVRGFWAQKTELAIQPEVCSAS